MAAVAVVVVDTACTELDIGFDTVALVVVAEDLGNIRIPGSMNSDAESAVEPVLVDSIGVEDVERTGSVGDGCKFHIEYLLVSPNLQRVSGCVEGSVVLE